VAYGLERSSTQYSVLGTQFALTTDKFSKNLRAY
jgi:hypothetical protein